MVRVMAQTTRLMDRTVHVAWPSATGSEGVGAVTSIGVARTREHKVSTYAYDKTGQTLGMQEERQDREVLYLWSGILLISRRWWIALRVRVLPTG